MHRGERKKKAILMSPEVEFGTASSANELCRFN